MEVSKKDDHESPGMKAHRESLEKGYLGENPIADQIPNSAYALTSGPKGVPLHKEAAVAAATFAPTYADDDEAEPDVPADTTNQN